VSNGFLKVSERTGPPLQFRILFIETAKCQTYIPGEGPHHRYSFGASSSVGIALGYGLDDRDSRVRFPAGAENFSLHHRVQNGSGSTQPSLQWVPGALSLGVKRPGCEADHSHPSNAEVREWSYISTPPIRLHGVVLS
jgi:hypothetical protein